MFENKTYRQHNNDVTGTINSVMMMMTMMKIQVSIYLHVELNSQGPITVSTWLQTTAAAAAIKQHRTKQKQQNKVQKA
jgi:hypothetical protein